MSSNSAQPFLSSPSALLRTTSSSLSIINQSPRVWLFGAKDKRVFRSKCSTVSKPRTQDLVLQNILKWHESVKDDIEGDDSWADSESFTAPDRIINTIACVVALKSWNVHPGKCENGMAYFKKNISNLRNENAVHMPFGFEVAFPSILELARSLNLEVPDDCPVLNEIYAMRNIKLEK